MEGDAQYKYAEFLVDLPDTGMLDLSFKRGTSVSDYSKAWIVVKNWTKSRDGLVALCPQTADFSEINHDIDRLINELEAIRRKARKLFEEHDW